MENSGSERLSNLLMVTQHHLPASWARHCGERANSHALPSPSSSEGMPVLSRGVGPRVASLPPPAALAQQFPPPRGSQAQGDVTAPQATNLSHGRKAGDHPGWGDPTHCLIPSSSLIILSVVVTFTEHKVSTMLRVCLCGLQPIRDGVPSPPAPSRMFPSPSQKPRPRDSNFLCRPPSPPVASSLAPDCGSDRSMDLTQPCPVPAPLAEPDGLTAHPCCCRCRNVLPPQV